MRNNLVSLTEVCEFKGGSQPPKSEWIKEAKDGYVRMLQIRDFTQKNVNPEFVKVKKGMNIAKEDDILIARYGASIGKIVTGLSGTYNVALIKAIPNLEVLSKKYLYYFLKSNIFQNFLLNLGSRAAQAGFNKSDLKSLNIYLPLLKEQDKIVLLLDKIVELITKRQAQIAALDELTQSLFFEMFGDPFYNPKRWKKGKIADLTESTQYGTSSKANEGSGEFPILRMNNITYKGGWDFSNLKYIDLDEKEQKKYLVHKGELLFNRTNSKELVGKTAVYRNDMPYAYAGYLVKLIPNNEANAEFISAYLNSSYGKRILLNKAKSIVGMANINAQELQSIDIYLPPKKSQDEYAHKIQSILKYQKELKDSLESYNNLYNSLLQKSFKGGLFQEQA